MQDPYADMPPVDEQEQGIVIPHNQEAERAVLGSVLIDPDVMYQIKEALVPSDFFIQRHKEIYEAYLRLLESKQAIDIITVTQDCLNHLGTFDVSYLNRLIGEVGSTFNVMSYVTIVEQKSVLRKILGRANDIAKLVTKQQPIDDTLREFDDLMHAPQDIGTSGNDDTQDSDEASLELLRKITEKIPTGVKTYFPHFDSIDQLAGFPIGGSILIGDSSFGKSALLLQVCEQVALGGSVSLYIGLESTNDAMVMRRVGGTSGVDGKKVRTATLTAAEETALVNEITNNYQGKYGGRLKLNSKAVTVQAVERAIRKHRPKLVVIDQISQIIDQPTPNPTLNLLANFTRLKSLGNKYDCAVVVVHAIGPEESRLFFAKNAKYTPGKKQKNSVPNINAIPWASQLKFLADVLLFLVPDVNQELAHATVYEILIWIMKDRDGSRFTPTRWKYTLKTQWFVDQPIATGAQQPSGFVAKPYVPSGAQSQTMPVPYKDESDIDPFSMEEFDFDPEPDESE